MLRLFAARENIDKERFIYDRITADGDETLVIVPDQYTLVAEEQALKYTGKDCLFDIEIISMSRLGLRLLTEQGTESVNMLDKYGRFMLLTRIIKQHADDFDIFRRSAGKQAFTAMLSDFISEFKQQECTVSEMEAMLEEEDADPLLRAKLGELSGVIEAYEQAVSGKYTDSEDFISMYIDAIGKSEMIRSKNIWIYGYDSITPKFTRAMLELSAAAKSVNFILNRSDFGLDERMERMLRAKCLENGKVLTCEEIVPEYLLEKTETILRIEGSLWSDDPSAAAKGDKELFNAEDLTVVCAANPYYEAESAAAFIWHLVRDLGYRMRDIQVIANDEGAMHPVIRRVFTEYGLPVFMDSARDITDTAPVAFIVDMLWFLMHGMNPDYLFAMLKTGLAGVPAEIAESLENYARNYHIRGSMWERDFKYGEEALGSEAFTGLNSVRAEVIQQISVLRDLAKDNDSTEDFINGLRAYLEETWHLSDAVEALAEETEQLGSADEAQRMRESYGKAMDLLDQITEIMGDEPFDLGAFTEIYVAGLTNVEVGVIPPAADGLSVGTMIRTRPRPVRAAVILGANEGILPMQPSPEGLFSVDEKEYFREKSFALGVLDEIKMDEENAAMYRMLSKPSDKLYISWSMTDGDGGELSPSSVTDSLKDLFPCIEKPGRILKDVVSSAWGDSSLTGGPVGDVIERPEESMRHMLDRIKDRNAPEGSDPLVRSLLSWYDSRQRGQLRVMLDAAGDENLRDPIGRDLARELYARADGSFVLSSSSINSYFECPFKYFVERGLRPQEEREFASDSRAIGDAYHECLMSVARRLLGDRELRNRISAFMKAVDEDGEHGEKEESEDVFMMIEKMVDEELAVISENYQEGLFISTGGEQFRMQRIREICTGAARAMAEQLSAESVMDASFEEGFSRHGRFDPVTLEVDGETVYVEGKIDRSDILNVDGAGRVRIIDYKTGSDKLDLHKMKSGYKMQLMIYMISATSGGLEPAGLFYFNIKDPIESIDSKTASKAMEIMERDPADTYKLKGKYVEEPGVLDAMPASVIAGTKNGISRDEFEDAKSSVIGQIRNMAEGIIRGDIRISPFKDNSRLVCSYCSCRSVCRRDREYTKNQSREIKPPEKDRQKA